MSCAACIQALAVEVDRVSSINSIPDIPCVCEQYSLSPLSPGPVVDDENLHYLVPTPNGLLENGYLNPTFVQQVEKNGLSVLRALAIDDEFELTVSQLRARWSQTGRKLHGIMTFAAGSVRYDNEDRLCCVYDTAEEDKPGHAELMAIDISHKMTGLTKSQIKQMREARIKKIVDRIGSNFESVATFRSGNLLHLANE